MFRRLALANQAPNMTFDARDCNQLRQIAHSTNSGHVSAVRILEYMFIVMEETFYPRKRDWVFVMIGSAGIAVIGVWMLSGESPLFRCLGGLVIAATVLFLI